MTTPLARAVLGLVLLQPQVAAAKKPIKSISYDLFSESKQFMDVVHEWKNSEKAPKDLCKDVVNICGDNSKVLMCAMCNALLAEEKLCGTRDGCTLHDAINDCVTNAAKGETSPFAIDELLLITASLVKILGENMPANSALQQFRAANLKINKARKAAADSLEAINRQFNWLGESALDCPNVANQKERLRDLEYSVQELQKKTEAEAKKQENREEVVRRGKLAGAAVGVALGLIGSGLMSRTFHLSADSTAINGAPPWPIAGAALMVVGVATTAAIVRSQHKTGARMLSTKAVRVDKLSKTATGLCALSTAASAALWLSAPLVWKYHNEQDALRRSVSLFDAAATVTATTLVCWSVAGGLSKELKLANHPAATTAKIRSQSTLVVSPYPLGLSLRFIF